MYRRKLSILLMILTIGAIVIFQAYWLRKSYEEEKRLFTLRSNLLFRETIFRLQASKFHMEGTINMKEDDNFGFVSMMNTMTPKGEPDSSGMKKHTQSVIISMRRQGGEPGKSDDSIKAQMEMRLFNFVSGLDSLKGPIPVKDVSDAYAKTLAKEKIHVPFEIFSTQKEKGQLGSGPDSSFDNRVTVGFSKPVEFRLEMGNSFWFLLRKLGPQAIFSFILVSCTILSFLFLYRNWQRQRKLTELKNDFISNITHELKTPIATVSVAVEALRNFNALQNPERTREYLDISAGELQRLSLLVDKVLKLSLFERQEIELKKDHFDLGILVEEVLASMRLQFEKYQAKVVFAGGGDFRLRADKLHLTSVIFNLLDNALKYSPHNPSIKVDLGTEEGAIVLSVTDNGLGIPAIYRERIFEKFFRIPTGDRHDVKGYGLGLSYVSYVVQREGGVISVESQEGIGSRFTVKIPRDHA